MMKVPFFHIGKIKNNPAAYALDACCYGVVFGFSDPVLTKTYPANHRL